MIPEEELNRTKEELSKKTKEDVINAFIELYKIIGELNVVLHESNLMMLHLKKQLDMNSKGDSL